MVDENFYELHQITGSAIESEGVCWVCVFGWKYLPPSQFSNCTSMHSTLHCVEKMFGGGTTLVLVELVEGDTSLGLEVLGELHR